MIELETIIGWAATGAVIIGHAYVTYDKTQENTRELRAIWAWKDSYEKEAAERRLDTQKQIGRLESRIEVHDGYYQQILTMLTEIKDELKDLRKNK